MVEGWKSGRIEKILISLIFVQLGVEKWMGRKNKFVKIYSYTLLKNNGQLKQINDKQPKKKKITQFIKN